MKKQSLEYRLLHSAQRSDTRAEAVIIYWVEELAEFMDILGEQGKPKRIVVDNIAVPMLTTASEIITAAGYVPGGEALYLHLPNSPSIRVPLPKPLEEMAQEELLQIADNLTRSINSQLIVSLRDYAIEYP